MALPNATYAPFLGIHAEPQGYQCAHYGAPVYHCVFPVLSTYTADELADEVLQYQADLWPAAPAMCLAFEGRGVVWPDWHKTRAGLIDAIEFVQALPCMSGDTSLIHWGNQMRSFMGAWARRPQFMPDAMVIYDIDTGLPGRQIAQEVAKHFKHLKKKHGIARLILRLPNGGSVMVHRYLEQDCDLGNLVTAIQRARLMELPEEFSAAA